MSIGKEIDNKSSHNTDVTVMRPLILYLLLVLPELEFPEVS